MQICWVGSRAYYDQLKHDDFDSLTDWRISQSTYARFLWDILKYTVWKNAAFDFSKVVFGQAKQLTRAQQIVQKVDRQKLGFWLRPTVCERKKKNRKRKDRKKKEEYFNEAPSRRVLDWSTTFQKSFENRIDKLDWMMIVPKLQAKEKLYAIN